ncbi:MAG TPA: MBL fold metallo-hydrolase [Chthonomonadaceae bacterium]|nr:MBL fold metallo-hydrolase [Chthonomonadaceae bacterium]
MQVTFWGTRGTVPVPGADTVRYGGNTTCISVLTAANELIILDAGTGIRNLGKQIAGQSGLLCATLFLSHSHWDHIQGFPLFAPAYDARFSLTVLGCATHSMSLRSILERQQDSPVFPVPLDALHADIDIGDYCMDWFTHGSVKMRTAPLHHPGGSCGFRIEEQGRALVFMTDNELPGPGAEWDRFVAFCGGADLLVHDAQYTDAELDAHRGWGHSSITQAIALANQAGVKRLALFHHDPDRTDDDLEGLVAERESSLHRAGSSLCVIAAAEGETREV